MLTTAELRWFYPGIQPAVMTYWFQNNYAGEDLNLPEEREDLYLHTVGCDYLNIKLRQERLEVKWRQAELGVVNFGRCKGNAEKWFKWVCEAPPAQSLMPATTAETGTWIVVKKSRTQCKYQVLSGESLTLVPVNADIKQGCTLELTQLNIYGKAWWSLAFEAFGEETGLIDTLQNVVDCVAKNYYGLPVQVENSYGYPKWLEIVSNL